MDRAVVELITKETGCTYEAALELLIRSDFHFAQVITILFARRFNPAGFPASVPENIEMELLKVRSLDSGLVLPDFIDHYSSELYYTIITDKIFDKKMESQLLTVAALNWWYHMVANAQRLHLLMAKGDGNCLLHSISLSLNGYDDQLLTLRRVLNNFCLQDPLMENVRRRWQLHMLYENSKVGVTFSEIEWKNEWQLVIDQTGLEVSERQFSYKGLESIHVFILAQILHKPIIMFAALEETYSPINFRGIYLPLEKSPTECSKNPLVLAYYGSHFSPLVYTSGTSGQDVHTSLPISTLWGDIFPIQFGVDPGENFDLENYDKNDLVCNKNQELYLFQRYLEVTELLPCYDKTKMYFVEDKYGTERTSLKLKYSNRPYVSFKSDNTKWFCVKVHMYNNPLMKKLVENYLGLLEMRHITKTLQESFPNLSKNNSVLRTKLVLEGLRECQSKGCSSFGTSLTKYKCRECYKLSFEGAVGEAGVSTSSTGLRGARKELENFIATMALVEIAETA